MGGPFYVYYAHQPYLYDDDKGKWIGNLHWLWFNDFETPRKIARKIYQKLIALPLTLKELDKSSEYRCMVSFSGTLLDQMKEMEEQQIFKKEGLPSFVELYGEVLSRYPDHIELLVMPWSFPYLIRTIPAADFYRQILRGKESILNAFGAPVAERVVGLFVPEFGLPVKEDLHALIAAAHRCGLHWILVDENNIETHDGYAVKRGRPYTLIGQSASRELNHMTALPCIGRIPQDALGGGDAARQLLIRELKRSPENFAIGGVCDLSGANVMEKTHWDEIKSVFSKKNENGLACLTGSQIVHLQLQERTLGLPAGAEPFRAFERVYSTGGLQSKIRPWWWMDGFDQEMLTERTNNFSQVYNQIRTQAASSSSPAVNKAVDEAEQALFMLQDSSYRFWGDSGFGMRVALSALPYVESKLAAAKVAVQTRAPQA